MGRYNSYARKIDELARQRFANYKTAKTKFDEAERAKKLYRSSEGKKKQIKVDADYETAKEELREAKDVLEETMKEVSQMRKELCSEVSREWAMNPKDLDMATVTLMNSGICSAWEIADLFERAGNATTKRFIGKCAKDEIERLPTIPNMTQQKALEAETLLRHIAHQADLFKDVNHAEPVMRFDAAADVLRRSIKTPNLIDKWDELTVDLLSEM